MNTFPETQTCFFIDGPIGQIECGTMGLPQDPKPLIFVMCHPQTTDGGTMTNKVVTTTCKAMHNLQIPTLAFNFRGAGNSDGEYDSGNGECDDLATVVAWARDVLPEADLWLGGFSFGSYVAYRSANTLAPKQLLSVAPSFDRYDLDAIPVPEMPWTAVVPNEDEIVDMKHVFDFLYRAEVDVSIIKMNGVGHFFHQNLIPLRNYLTCHYASRI